MTHERSGAPESDHSLPARLRASVQGVRADPDRLIAGAVRAGRHRRRRRLLREGALAGTAIVMLGAGSYAAVSAHRAPEATIVAGPAPRVSDSPSPAAPTSTPGSSPTPTLPAGPGPTPPATSEPAADTQLTARVAALHLRQLSPPGTFSHFEGQQSPDEVYAALRVDLGEGDVGVQVNVQGNFLQAGGDADNSEIKKFYRCGRGGDGTVTACQAEVDRQGNRLLLTTQRLSGGGTVYVADHLDAAEGNRIVVMTGNTVDLKHGGNPRQGLSRAQATAIATDPVWSLYTPPSAADTAAARRLIKPWKLLPN